jgi:hypothetical protein
MWSQPAAETLIAARVANRTIVRFTFAFADMIRPSSWFPDPLCSGGARHLMAGNSVRR